MAVSSAAGSAAVRISVVIFRYSHIHAQCGMSSDTFFECPCVCKTLPCKGPSSIAVNRKFTHTPIIGGSRNRHSGSPQTFALVVLVSGPRTALLVTLRTNLETCPVVCAARHVSTVAVMSSDAWGKWTFTSIFPLIIIWPERTGVFYDESPDIELVSFFNVLILLIGS